MSDYVLVHHGIKGQRWGVRRFQTKDGSLTPAGKKRRRDSWSDDARGVRQLKKKSINQMSNAELRKYNERTRLEQEYSKLNPNVIKKGWKYVAGAAVVTNTAVNLYNNGEKLMKIGKVVVDNMIKE